ACGDYGELHDPETHLIPLVLRVAAGLRDSVQIYGTDYPTDDGTAVRDYIHVEDLARAHLLALDAITPGIHAIYNLGNGTGVTVGGQAQAAAGEGHHFGPVLVVVPAGWGLVALDSDVVAEVAGHGDGVLGGGTGRAGGAVEVGPQLVQAGLRMAGGDLHHHP